MKESTKKKLKLTIGGYTLTGVNLYMQSIDQHIVALLLGLTAIHLFIEALKVKDSE